MMADLQESFRSLFTVNMGAQRGERIVVLSDTIRADEGLDSGERDRRQRLHDVARQVAEFGDQCYGNASFIAFPATAASGAEPPEAAWRAVFGDALVDALASAGLLRRLLQKEADAAELEAAREMVRGQRSAVAAVVVALANNSTSHTRFRALANLAGSRFASLPHFDPDMFLGSMLVDWQALAARTETLALAVNNAVSLEVQTPDGTSLAMDKRGRRAEGDTGILTAPGSFGNLPAGEVYLAPVEGSSNGTLVIRFAPTRPLREPLTLTVKDGLVTDMAGDDPYRGHLEEKFLQSEANRNIAELGIGTNDRATRPDNVLEAEKILGTIHVALGDNSGFGGVVSTPFHEDFVCYSPTLTAIDARGDRTLLLEGGKLLINV
jgi:leucyl aminopeptidase (aminopeptidase T)